MATLDDLIAMRPLFVCVVAVMLLAFAGCAPTVDLASPPPATAVPDIRGTWAGSWGGGPVRLVISEQRELGGYSGLYVGPVQLLGRRYPSVTGVVTSTIAGAPVSTSMNGWLGYSNGRLTLLVKAETPAGPQEITLFRTADDRWSGLGGSSFPWGPQGPVELVRLTGS